MIAEKRAEQREFRRRAFRFPEGVVQFGFE
jgi:hypothetical protein